MDFNKLTLKSQEAVGAAQELARRMGNPEIYPEHLLLALLDQELPQQLVPDAAALRAQAETTLRGKPAVAGGAQQPQVSRAFSQILDKAFDEARTIVGAGAAEGAVDAANMLKPMLARGELRAIGATTLDEYRKHIEKDAALERRFQPVYVGEPSVVDTIAILRGLKERYEAHHGVEIRDSALVSAAVLSDRYITDRFLPDKAIDLVDEAASRLK